MKRLAGAVSVALVVASGCGGGDGGEADGAATTTSLPAPTVTTGGSPDGGAAEPTTTSAPAATSPDLAAVRIRLTRVAGLEQPLALTTRRGDDALYVAEKTGRVRVVRGGAVADQPVLDLRGDVSTGGEQGLLGLAFSPDGGRMYVDYTDPGGDTRVVEYEFRGGRADPGSRRELLRVDQPFANHNGGHLAVGPDGMLYVALGDGGSGGDPQGNGQDTGTLLGSILRLDPRPTGDSPYGAPADNPFVGVDGARPEIWVYGLRNPWRFSFDRATGDLWIGDVGQNQWEEITRLSSGEQAGANLGWNRLEGTHRFSGDPPADHVAPVYEYSHGATGGCSVTGGYVYRGSRIPALRGAYVFADYCVGEVQALALQGGGEPTVRNLGVSASALASFGEDADGELYVLSLGGDLLRLDPA